MTSRHTHSPRGQKVFISSQFVGISLEDVRDLDAASIREFALRLCLRLAYFLRDEWNRQAQERDQNYRFRHRSVLRMRPF